jgi:Ca-activated chloride channel homolog
VGDVAEDPPMIRARLAGAAALIALLAAIVALVDPHSGSTRPRIVLAVDRSTSIDASMRATESRWIGDVASSASGCVRPCRIVAFADSANALPPGARALAAGGRVPGAAATDLERGIAAAVAASRDGGRVIVLSDGEETEGDPTRVVAAARARHVTVDAVPLADTDRRDAALTRLDAPRAVRQRDTISLLVTVHSTVIAPGLLSVTHDGGRPANQGEVFRRGDNPFTLSYTAAKPGWHSFRVRVTIANDARRENDVLAVSVDVGAAPRVDIVSSSASPAIASILASKGIRARVEPASALPAHAAGYAATDAVVLDDLPADRLATPQITALTSAVRDDGLGLLTLGGPHAYSLGGYAHSGLNDLLPLASLVPGDLQRRNLALELVLDRSGSMSDTSRGVRKIVMAQSAAKQAARFVSTHQDEFGIVDFDIVPHLLLAQRRVTSSSLTDRVDAQIDRLEADGGTDIYLGLQAGYRQILRSTSPNRHIILLTDGISQPHRYTTLLKNLVKHHITVATVALGSDVDSELLREIAKATGGNSYETTDAHDLPKIFVKETRLSARPVQISGRQQVIARDSSPIVRSLAGKRLPALTGNVVTRLQLGAQAGLLAKSGTATSDPALAEWGVGLGRVVSWTPGLGAPWARAWTAETGLWNDAVRFVARGLPDPPVAATASEGTTTQLQVDLGANAPTDRTTITGRLEGAGAATRPVTLRETSPSVYTETLPPRPAGSYGLTLDLPASLGGRQRVLVDVPYPAEDVPSPAGRATLGQIAAETGGSLLPATGAPQLARAARSWRTPLLVLALVLFLLSVSLRLLVRSSRPRS